jgi:hypothetical protein
MKMKLRRHDRNRFELEIIKLETIFSSWADPERLFRQTLECLPEDIGSIPLSIGHLPIAHREILPGEILHPFQITKTRPVALMRACLSYARPLGQWRV